ncbi:RICIN domain-containing protein [Streptomyces sp. H10-C2]|uniref:RICIN domain-containing protein n=1 Tax=unclassified Streptomyces TaxID=2593676 RepID=UPI0024BA6CBD|nr:MULTISPECIES: RICIN domain-containing protein [unclassified Streptomyces]MDJ0347599.1 RICIN domain-containing protein [Streptomyces sp. PH10-H1]MDJ0375804.1 RICIN domain-containing protein [Streptomyces sp. H10-C2]
MSIRRKIATSAGTFALAAITCLVTSPSAHALSGVVQIKFDNGLCLDVPNADAHSMQYVQQWGCNGTNAQQWKIINIDPTHFKIQSTISPYLCLNNWQGGDKTGNDIVLYACVNDGDGQFNIVNNNGNTWPIDRLQPKSAATNCVNMWGGDQWGNHARLYPCNNASNEVVTFGYV